MVGFLYGFQNNNNKKKKVGKFTFAFQEAQSNHISMTQ